MHLLFKRAQVYGFDGSPRFRLLSRIDVDLEEQGLIDRYRMRSAVIIYRERENHIRDSIFYGVIAALGVATVFNIARVNVRGFGNWYAHVKFSAPYVDWLLFAFAILLCSYIAYHQLRRTIYVRDLLRGRSTTCDSVVELAREEAYIQMVVSFFRQVLETAKNWGHYEAVDIPALPPDEAKKMVIRGI